MTLHLGGPVHGTVCLTPSSQHRLKNDLFLGVQWVLPYTFLRSVETIVADRHVKTTVGKRRPRTDQTHQTKKGLTLHLEMDEPLTL